jgi:hypothetical protein
MHEVYERIRVNLKDAGALYFICCIGHLSIPVNAAHKILSYLMELGSPLKC